MLRELTGKDKVERIAVLVSFNGTSKLIGAPKVHQATGENVAECVHEKLNEWKIADKIAAISFDTTSSNTGVKWRMQIAGKKDWSRSAVSRIPQPIQTYGERIEISSRHLHFFGSIVHSSLDWVHQRHRVPKSRSKFYEERIRIREKRF